MKRTIIQCAFALACLSLILAAGLLSVPSTSARIACGGTTCTCPPPDLSTTSVWGLGSNCSEAFDNAVASARSQINCANGQCSEGVVIDIACFPATALGYAIQLHLVYRCYSCTADDSACPVDDLRSVP